MNTHYTPLVVLLSVLLVGCSDQDSDWTGTVYDSAGVTIVSNPDFGMWAPGEAWTLEEELRIGAVEGDPEYLFGEILGLTVDSHGRIFVLDFQAQHVQVYSADGVHEQTIGGPGEGPGELSGAVSIFMGPGDTLLIQDNRALRFNRYSPDGSSVPGFRMVFEGRRGGSLRATPSGMMAEQFEARDIADGVIQKWIVRLAADGTNLDTLLAYSSPPLLGPEGRLHRGSRFYIPEMMWDLSDDLELVCGMNDTYRISIYFEGRLGRIITKPFQPTPVEDAEKELIRDRLVSIMREAGFPPELLVRMRAVTPIAESYPAFQGLSVGPWGTIWAQQTQRVSELNDLDFWAISNLGRTKGSREWDVFDPEGRFQGVVTMPERFTPWLFRADKVYGTWYDEYDVPYVVRLGVVGDLGAGTP